MDYSTITDWVDNYVKAWNSNDPAEIGALFAEEAAYRTSPFEAPWTGREAIVRQWLARQDPPGSTTFRYEVLATTGDTAIVRGWTNYIHHAGREFSNIWLIQLDAQGRCRAFTEWWMQKPAP